MSNSDKPAIPESSIAIVGMSGRFPGARDVATFWDNLKKGVESITFFAPEELDSSLDPDLVSRPDYIRAKGRIDDADMFDAGFFGYSPIEASIMDPQQRILLELAWETLEDAGIVPQDNDNLVGVWVGTNWNRYYANNVRGSAAARRFGEFNAELANEFDFPASRISYKLDLRGPSVTLATACSTSLVAVSHAMQSLLGYECDVALAGAASVIVPVNAGYLYQEGSMLSSDGHCRPFDSQASGTTFNDGAAMVALKRVEDAVRDGDRIYAVIRAIAVNNDGADKVSYTAPSVGGQMAALQTALAMGDIDPASVAFLETHGTATPLGDPIEVAAVQGVYGQDGSDQPCALGSLKSNIGHVIHAAGVTGLIKAALSVREGVIPPTINFEEANPALNLGDSRFFVNNQLVEWPQSGPVRRAGVSSFGVGGTNAHAIVEQPPATTPVRRTATDEQAPPLYLVSARHVEALAGQLQNLATFAHQEGNEDNAGDLGYSLARTRTHFEQRAVIYAPTISAVAGTEAGSKNLVRGKAKKIHNLVFAFPGQGAQMPGMGAGLIESSAVYRQALTECIRLANQYLDIDLGLLIADAASTDDRISETAYTQPALFAVGYALARHYQSVGLTPDLLIGHSIGEFAAACIAGVFDLESAVKVVCERGRLMQAQPPGSMLAVSATPEEVARQLPEGATIAAQNGPTLCVVAGETDLMENLAQQLAELEIRTTMLQTSHAFHSPMMDGALDEFRLVFNNLQMAAPAIPIVSTATGQILTAEQATSADYWVRQIRNPVQFSAAVQYIVTHHEGSALLELGPGRTLSSLFSQQAGNTHIAVPALTQVEQDDTASTWLALGALWCGGYQLPLESYWPRSRHQRLALPTYAFHRSRHWLDPVARSVADESEQADVGETEKEQLDTRTRLINLINESTGLGVTAADCDKSFHEIGLDSLLLTQFAVGLQDTFGVTVKFRDLSEELNSVATLSPHIDANMPPSEEQPAARTGVSDERLAIHTHLDRPTRSRKARGAHRRDTRPTEVTSVFQLGKERADALASFVAAQNARTAGSKAHVDEHRGVHADPRTAAGVHKVWKELAYPLVCNRSDGANVWDIDGNRYVDMLNGFGPNFLGHGDPQIREALLNQLSMGVEIGPQTPLAGETAKLVCQLTGMDRASFMCTGSEAVQAALRCARTFTRRSKVVVFEGAYHGNFDEVLVRGANQPGELRSVPASPGVPRGAVADIIVLPWANSQSLAVIEELGDRLAAVMVEPVQSRKPEIQPGPFLKALRDITSRHGALLIFDEVVTGFRCHPGGAQAYFDVKADIATYGKVAGGSMPIGIVAGRQAVMDTFDGGMWRFGDDSMPTASVTFFAGTFVRHPLAMAACHTMLAHLIDSGPQLQSLLADRAKWFTDRLNALFEAFEAPYEAPCFSSVIYLRNNDVSELGSLLWFYLRHHGVFALESFPSYLTVAHTEEVLEEVLEAFRASLQDMVNAGFLVPPRRLNVETSGRGGVDLSTAVTGARPGQDDQGMPNWYLAADAERQCRKADDQQPVDYDPFARGEIEQIIKTSESQQEVWLAAQMGDEASMAFNESVSLQLTGALDVAALKQALEQLVLRHSAMRASVSPDGQYLKIARNPSIELPLVSQPLVDFVAIDVATPFDLTWGPLFRFALFGSGAEKHTLVMTAHHVVCDGWSTLLILQELGTLYDQARGSKSAPLAPPDALEKYNELASDLGRTVAEDYWLDEYATLPPVLDFPTVRQRPAQRRFASERLDLVIAAERLAAYKAFARASNASLFNLMLTAWVAYLARVTGVDDVVVGIPMAGQPGANMPNLVSHCVNLLPLRVRVDPAETFSQTLLTVKAKLLDAIEHQDYTFGRLLKRLPIERDPSRLPLVPIQFNLDPPADTRPAGFTDLTTRTAVNPRAFENFELFINMAEVGDVLEVQTQFNSVLFDAVTVGQRLEEFLRLLDDAAQQPSVEVSRLALMAPQVRTRWLEQWNDTDEDFGPDHHFLQLFAHQVGRRADCSAVTCGDRQLTYAQLDARAESLADHLRQLPGGAGDLIGIAVPRSVEMLICLLAVWKTRAAYVPIDPEFPAERIRLMVEDAAIQTIVTHSSVADLLRDFDGRKVNINDLELSDSPPQEPSPIGADSDLAYVIFTSGSTGRPKGVEITHGAVSNFLHSMVRHARLDENARLVAVTTLSFDIAVLELYAPLVTGGSVVVGTAQDVAEGNRLRQLLDDSDATVMQATPVTWRMLVDAGWSPGRDFAVLCGGEAFPSDLATDLCSRSDNVLNLYGPTETTVWSAVYRIEPGAWQDSTFPTVPIGRPLHNTRLFVLDSRRQPVPPGVAGELYIGGSGLARGYLNREELTAERFVEHEEFGRLYRTGDRVVMDSSEALRFLERVDNQVKVRGFRIELGEIEAALARHPGVREAAVTVYEPAPGDARLSAYCVMAPGVALDIDGVREALGASLPRYMIPQHITEIAEIPLTPNRKVNRRALPAPGHTATEMVAPRNEAERISAQVWQTILGMEAVSIHHDFFYEGGHSILATRVIGALREQGITVPLQVLFAHSKLSEFAKHVAAAMLRGDAAASADEEREVLSF